MKPKALKVVETLSSEHVVEDCPPQKASHEAFAVTCPSELLAYR